MTAVAAVVLCVLLVCLAVFQLALIVGAPLGHFAWGGRDRVLPTTKRVGSAISIVLYALFALIVLERSGFAALLPSRTISVVGIWFLFAYFVIGIAMNALSRSKPERMTMTPVCALLAALTLVVALS